MATALRIHQDAIQLSMPGCVDQKQVLQDIRNYLAGQSIGLTRDESLLDEVLKCAFCRAELNRATAPAGKRQASFPEDVARTYRRIFKEITARFPYLFENDVELLLGPEQIKYVDDSLRLLEASPRRDLVADIYETFIGSAVRGQDGQFFTPQNAVDLLVAMSRPEATDLVIDPACGAGSFLSQAAKIILDGSVSARKCLHGIDKDEYLGRLARLRLALQFGEPANIHCADSLAWSGKDFEQTTTSRLKGKFTLVLTNPPFGARIVAATGDIRGAFDLAYKWRFETEKSRFVKNGDLQNNPAPQVLFVERCLSLLAPGGRLGMVVPESLISSPSHRYVVQYMLDNATVVAVVGMPESLFKISGKGGTHTKVCLVVLKKEKPRKGHNVFMAEAKWCGHDSRGREIEKDDTPEIARRFDLFRSGGKFQQDRLGFVVSMSDIRNLVLAPRYYDPEPRLSLQKLSGTHDLLTVRDLVDQGYLSITTGDEPGKLTYGTGDVPFIRTSDLSNWEIKIDPKHCVSEEYYRQVAKKQDVREQDILMVRDGTYLIGTCAFVTNYDTKICYQSHIYKLRVHEGGPVDGYLLLALLSSEPVISQIRAMSFTQDIIDSLGDRIYDLVLPIPRSAHKRSSVSDLVRKVIQDRVEARELARRAREMVVR